MERYYTEYLLGIGSLFREVLGKVLGALCQVQACISIKYINYKPYQSMKSHESNYTLESAGSVCKQRFEMRNYLESILKSQF